MKKKDFSTIDLNKGYCITDAAAIINRSRNTVSNYIKNGILRAYEGRRRVRCSKEGEPLRAMLIKGRELVSYINNYG